MLGSVFRRTTLHSRRFIKRGGHEADGHHHHELTNYTDGGPSVLNTIKWLGFIAGVPAFTVFTMWNYYVGAARKTKLAERAAAREAALTE
ncbi:hypothetical protein AKO1_012671 [Acrasis kona]|uniref:Uncharacterized protein n=1 Tax=Acrasis kona TaxID=1008807 RepID=A0AAW2YWI9_9EUKA